MSKKNLGEYKKALELNKKQLSDCKRILKSAKRSYNKTVAENKELKTYIENIKHFFLNINNRSRLNF